MDNISVEEKMEFIPPKVWVIAFDIRAKGKGCAVVKANNPEQAGEILKASGIYNGTPSDYLINKIEEVVTPPCCGLMAEEYVNFFNND